MLATHPPTSSPEVKIWLNNIPVQHANQLLEIKNKQSTLMVQLINCQSDSVAFFMENLDTAWIYPPFPLIRYSSIPGGDFTLYCADAHHDTTMLKLHVMKSLTEESWFFPTLIGYILLIILAIAFLWVIYELRQRLKLQSIRNQIASDLHDEVGSSLSSVAIRLKNMSRKIPEQNSDLKSKLNDLEATSHEIVQNLRDSVWLINPVHESFEEMCNKIRNFASKILEARNTQFHYENRIPPERKIVISTERRYNVYMIIKEAINNISKHANAKNAWIHIELKDDLVRIIVKDDGSGFDMKSSSEGNGVKNYQNRADTNFLIFAMESESGIGTKIQLDVPLL